MTLVRNAKGLQPYKWSPLRESYEPGTGWMNFLSVAQADRRAAEKAAGQPQLFLWSLVALCGHWIQQPHFLILAFISLGTELRLSAELSTPALLHPRLIALPPPLPSPTALSPAVTSWQPQDSKSWLHWIPSAFVSSGSREMSKADPNDPCQGLAIVRWTFSVTEPQLPWFSVPWVDRPRRKPGGWKQLKWMLSQFKRPVVQSQGVGRVSLL